MTAAKEPTEQESELLHNSIYETLRNHRLSHQFTGEGDSYPLIDALTPNFKTVDIGDEEIKRLADELYDNLNTAVEVILNERSKALGDPNGSFDKCMQAISDRDTEARAFVSRVRPTATLAAMTLKLAKNLTSNRNSCIVSSLCSRTPWPL